MLKGDSKVDEDKYDEKVPSLKVNERLITPTLLHGSVNVL